MTFLLISLGLLAATGITATLIQLVRDGGPRCMPEHLGYFEGRTTQW